MFEWDDGNLNHIARHRVDSLEAEEAFRDRRRIPFVAYDGPDGEPRDGRVGRTDDGRLLVVISVRRGRNWRIVTARDANSTETRRYRRANR